MLLKEELEFIPLKRNMSSTDSIKSSGTVKRQKLIDWIFMITYKHNLAFETLTMSIGILDKIISIYSALSDDKLTLIALVSVFISSKYYDRRLKMEHLLTNECTRQDIVVTEILILTKLKFKLPVDEVSNQLCTKLLDIFNRRIECYEQFACYIYVLLSMVDVGLLRRVNGLTLTNSIIYFTYKAFSVNPIVDCPLHTDRDMIECTLLIKQHYENFIHQGRLRYLTKYGFFAL
jgi:hypothetical protein